jgi:hypothetical protein
VVAAGWRIDAVELNRVTRRLLPQRRCAASKEALRTGNVLCGVAKSGFRTAKPLCSTLFVHNKLETDFATLQSPVSGLETHFAAHFLGKTNWKRTLQRYKVRFQDWKATLQRTFRASRTENALCGAPLCHCGSVDALVRLKCGCSVGWNEHHTVITRREHGPFDQALASGPTAQWQFNGSLSDVPIDRRRRPHYGAETGVTMQSWRTWPVMKVLNWS